MKVIAFLADAAVVDRIISHLKLTFVADRPPPRLTSPAGRNIVVDEVRMGSQLDSERVPSSGQKRKFLCCVEICRAGIDTLRSEKLGWGYEV